uniref:hypothetical protein n=1 Tax=Edaphosphingomonas laterariae TaxID=861865 RepID=UPI0011818952|nr:hypothetical protein [Sphingomonas laterariae]
MACASKFAEAATFQRRNIFAIAEDAAKQCAAEIDASAKSLDQGVETGASDEETLSLEYVGAKARVAAWNVIINRLEGGESVAVPSGLDPTVGEMQARYIECSRSAGGIKFSSVFFGDEWLADTLKKSEESRIQAFVEVGRQLCPKTYQNLVVATRAAGEGKSRTAQQQLQLDLAGAEHFAAGTWLKNAQKE